MSKLLIIKEPIQGLLGNLLSAATLWLKSLTTSWWREHLISYCCMQTSCQILWLEMIKISHKANLNVALLDCLWYSKVIQIWKWIREPIRNILSQCECWFLPLWKDGLFKPWQILSLCNHGTCGLAVSLTMLTMNWVWIQIGLLISTQARACETCSNASCFHIFLLQSLKEASYSNGPSSESWLVAVKQENPVN